MPDVILFCDSCIRKIASNLSKDSSKILSVLTNEVQLNIDSIRQKTGLTYAITQRAIWELKGSSFIYFEEDGRSKMVSLTDSGRRLIELYINERKGK